MKEFRPRCLRCPHEFHAHVSCDHWDSERGRPCACEGSWHEEARQISGFCHVISGTTRAAARASHAACPGEDYYYPCECDCHDDVKDS